MAGTAPGSVAAEVAARLSASGKDAREHRFVVDAMRDALALVAASIDVPDTPVVEHFGSLAHLVTPIRGTLVDDGTGARHRARPGPPAPPLRPRSAAPPPTPRSTSIRRLEPFDRGPYAGPVGWVDARGDGAFAVALRGAELDGLPRTPAGRCGHRRRIRPRVRVGRDRDRSSSRCSAPSSSPRPRPSADGGPRAPAVAARDAGLAAARCGSRTTLTPPPDHRSRWRRRTVVDDGRRVRTSVTTVDRSERGDVDTLRGAEQRLEVVGHRGRPGGGTRRSRHRRCRRPRT